MVPVAGVQPGHLRLALRGHHGAIIYRDDGRDGREKENRLWGRIAETLIDRTAKNHDHDTRTLAILAGGFLW